MGNYEKFKSLLEYFVAHLEWLNNKDETGRGYQRYIDWLIKGNKFKKSGQGYAGNEIQKQVERWGNYEGQIICISVYAPQPKSKGCYLNWINTSDNIRAIWNGESVSALNIVTDSYPVSAAQDVLTISVPELGLFDNQSPNQHLINFFNKFYELTLTTMEKYAALLKETRNLIFTGAPGTGKTYLAKQIAAEIIGVDVKDLANNEQFAFVQFHPSYDYTDFVEGLRPTRPDEKGNIGFELKSGIFKAFCEKAKKPLKEFTIENFVLYMNNDKTKKTIKNYAEGTVQNYKTAIEQLLGQKKRAKEGKILDVPKFEDLNKLANANLANIKEFEYSNDITSFYSSPIELLKIFKKSLEKNFVFVIDEINRGEISKIFGELFFSIDPSYRGAKGAVKTQFSNLHEDDSDDFYVPENVYIIGTMNDIDRSVESFDFAMRRRFTWQEIAAKESAANMRLPEEIVKRMDNLNTAIDKIEGLNSSYHIGGVYFLDENSEPNTDFDKIWKLRLAPLLKEYLRGMPNAEDKLKDLKAAYDKQ